MHPDHQRVRLGQETESGQESVTGEVRKEQVEVDGDVDPDGRTRWSEHSAGPGRHGASPWRPALALPG